jgi:glyoxylase I family protein
LPRLPEAASVPRSQVCATPPSRGVLAATSGNADCSGHVQVTASCRSRGNLDPMTFRRPFGQYRPKTTKGDVMSVDQLLAVVPVSRLPAGRDRYSALFGRAPDNDPMPSVGVAGDRAGLCSGVRRTGPGRLGSAQFRRGRLDAHNAKLRRRGLQAEPVVDADNGVRLSTLTDRRLPHRLRNRQHINMIAPQTMNSAGRADNPAMSSLSCPCSYRQAHRSGGARSSAVRAMSSTLGHHFGIVAPTNPREGGQPVNSKTAVKVNTAMHLTTGSRPDQRRVLCEAMRRSGRTAKTVRSSQRSHTSRDS